MVVFLDEKEGRTVVGRWDQVKKKRIGVRLTVVQKENGEEVAKSELDVLGRSAVCCRRSYVEEGWGEDDDLDACCIGVCGREEFFGSPPLMKAA